MSIGNNSPSAVVTRNMRHVRAQATFFQDRLPALEEAIRVLIAENEYLRGERAAVVAWLRKPGEYVDPACSRLADCIEHGLHRREEER